jgi:hypothetical protein
VDILTPAPPITPGRTIVTERPKRRWPKVVGAAGAATIAIGAVTAGAILANAEPLVVDNTGVALRPQALIAHEAEATPPGGPSFTEYRLGVDTGDRFTYRFWLHNDGPFSVTVTAAATLESADVRTISVRMGPASGTLPVRSELPYTISAHGYAMIQVRQEVRRCLPDSIQLGIGAVPISYTSLGLFHHDAFVVMPMEITLNGATGVDCPT